MESTWRLASGRRWPFMLAGPCVFGAVLGAQFDAFALAQHAVVLPATVCGVAFVMLPGLFVAMTLVNRDAPGFRRVFSAVTRSLVSVGLILLGIAAPVAFLLATTVDPILVYGLGAVGMVVAVSAGASRLFSGLLSSDDIDAGARLVGGAAWQVAMVAVWVIISATVGARLFGEAVMQ